MEFNARQEQFDISMFAWTDKQKEAMALMADPAVNEIFLYGGARAAKTFLIMCCLVFRALKAPFSRHAVIRSVFKDVKNTIAFQTLIDIKRKLFTPIGVELVLHKQDWLIDLPQTGSKIWLAGVDDNKRLEQVLGLGLNTVFLNEASKMNYKVLNLIKTRLAEKCPGLLNRLYIDANPPPTHHWTFKRYIKGVEPIDKTPLDMSTIRSLLMNPTDNLENIAPGYIEDLRKLPKSVQARFLYGEFAPVLDGAVYADEMQAAEKEDRFKEVLPDPNKPFYASFDIGHYDATAVWVAQFDVNAINLLYYFEDTRKSMTFYLEKLYAKFSNIAKIYVPFDAENRSWVTGKSRREEMEDFVAGRHTRIRPLPKYWIDDGINVCRLLLPRCHFNLKTVYDGLESLQNYKYEYSDHLGRNKDEPLHDWASHGADSFRYLMMGYGRFDELNKPKAPNKKEVLEPFKLTMRQLLEEKGIRF